MELPFKFKRIPTIGDGSCFIHSVLGACNKKYQNLNRMEKINMVREIRNLIGDYLEKGDIYDKLSRGSLKEFSQYLPEVDKKNMVKYMKSNSWINYLYIELLSKLFDINIYIVYNLHTSNNLYKLGDNELLYNSKLNSIFINYIDDTHFETLNLLTENGWKSFFSSSKKKYPVCPSL